MLLGPIHHQHRPRQGPRPGYGVLVVGRLLAGVSLVVWAVWLTWRVVTVPSAIGIAVLAVELVAFAAALALTVGVWSGVPAIGAPDDRGAGARVRALLRALDPPTVQPAGAAVNEWFAARRGLAAFRQGIRGRESSPGTPTLVSMVVATDGIRRAAMVGAVVVVLLTGAVPLQPPPPVALVALVAGIGGVAVAHLLLTGGALRPGDRLIWSVSTIGAGLGRRAAESPLSVRWTGVMATIVVLNLAVALRGVSDRWTHGLGEMPRDARIAAMILALALAATSLGALRRLSPPQLGQFGATGRLEELSTRRWALTATGVVAVLGLIVGSLPAGVGS